jgi:hypothetical protein
MHPDQRTRRLGGRAAAGPPARAGGTPDVTGYRLLAVARYGIRLLFSQLHGALRRIRAGQAREQLVERAVNDAGPEAPTTGADDRVISSRSNA